MFGETLLVVAYAVVWVVLIGYVVLTARRLTRLEAELRVLRAAHAAPADPSAPPSPSTDEAS